MKLKLRNLLCVLTVTLAASPGSSCLARDIYLAIRGDGRTGTGTQGDPFDASSPDSYDARLAAFRSGTNFHYAPGTYRTHGYSYGQRETVHAGCRHFGAGVDRTVIQLVDASNIDRSQGVIFGADYNRRADGFEVHDLTLDCNAENNPIFRNGLGAIGAFNACGSNILLQNLKVIHYGSAKRGREAFVLFCYPGASFRGATFHNVTYDHLVFTNPARGNADGVTIATIGAAEGVTMVGGKVTNCRFLGAGGDAWFSHAFYAQICEKNYVDGCTHGLYLEPEDTQNYTFTVVGNTFLGVRQAIYIVWHPGSHLGSLILDNNYIALRSDVVFNGSIGVDDGGLNNGGAHCSIESIQFENNRVVVGEWGEWASHDKAVDLRSPHHTYTIGRVQIAGNSVTLPTATPYQVQADIIGKLEMH